jgi:prophage antirepressor-like protein
MAEQQQHLITAEFFGNPVSIIDHAGRQWITAEQAGRCLGYSEAQSRKAVINLYNKHADEFSEEDMSVIELMTEAGLRECRIFSATGCQKLGFFARTARAKEFRTWAAKVLSKKLAAPVAPAPVPAPSSRLGRQPRTDGRPASRRWPKACRR